METSSRKLIALLKADGWKLVSQDGSHQTFKLASIPLLITVPHPRKDLPTGLVRRIYRDAGWGK